MSTVETRAAPEGVSAGHATGAQRRTANHAGASSVADGAGCAYRPRADVGAAAGSSPRITITSGRLAPGTPARGAGIPAGIRHGGERHRVSHPNIPSVKHVGFRVNGDVQHPDDARPVLAIATTVAPGQAPWKTMPTQCAIGARPIHDGLLWDQALRVRDQTLAAKQRRCTTPGRGRSGAAARETRRRPATGHNAESTVLGLAENSRRRGVGVMACVVERRRRHPGRCRRF